MYAVVGLWAATDLAFFLAASVVAHEAGGPGAVGLVGAVRVLSGAPCMGLVAVVADRASRPMLVAGVNVVFIAVSLLMALTVSAGGSLVVILLLQGVGSIASAFFKPSLQGLLPRLVPLPSQLVQAGAVWSVVNGVGSVLGPGIGGLLLASGGPGVLYVALAVGYAVTAAIAASIRTTYQPAREPPGAAGRSAPWWWSPLRGIGLFAPHGTARCSCCRWSSGHWRARRRVPGPLRLRGARCRRRGSVGHAPRRRGSGEPPGLDRHPGGRRPAHAVVVRRWGAARRAASGRAGGDRPGGRRDARPRGLRCGRRLGGHLRIRADQPPASRPRGRPRLAPCSAWAPGAAALGSLAAPLLARLLGLSAALVLAGVLADVVVAAGVPGLRTLARRTVPRPEDVALLSSVGVPASLPGLCIERVAVAAGRWAAEPGEVVVGEGEAGQEYFVVALLRMVPRTATVVAVRPSVLLTLDREVFVTIVTAHRPTQSWAEGAVAGLLAKRSPAHRGSLTGLSSPARPVSP